MFELKRTHARKVFKGLLGQANHFLITILVGLNGVRNGTARLDEEFRTSWNPRDVKRSAERSRSFVLDLALIRAIDALDLYMMLSRRKPCALTSHEFMQCMDRTGQKISKRLDVFTKFLPPLAQEQFAFLKLAIDWRNRLVHSLAGENLENSYEEVFLSRAESLRTEHSGLDVNELLTRYKARESPSFKDAASVIRLSHNAVSHFDAHLLSGLDIERYVREAIRIELTDSSNTDAGLKRACTKIWGNPDKRRAKAIRALRFVGVHQTSEIKARQVPDAFVDSILAMTPEEAHTFLKMECDERVDE